VATYIVGFDGKWQGTFDDREEAIEWEKKLQPADGWLRSSPGALAGIDF
jgi:hypothetical protein